MPVPDKPGTHLSVEISHISERVSVVYPTGKRKAIDECSPECSNHYQTNQRGCEPKERDRVKSTPPKMQVERLDVGNNLTYHVGNNFTYIVGGNLTFMQQNCTSGVLFRQEV